MTINLHLPSQNETLRPTITVIGVGGAGGNAVNNMINSRLEGVDFVVANTDAQALESSLSDRTIQLGTSVTRGLGAGADPSIGEAAAEEALDDIIGYMQGSNMVFITAGMGGGTGTGAAPVIARAAKEQGILTVGVTTKPFQFEGGNRMRLAEQGLNELQKYVDTLIVIPNQNLFRLATEKTTFADAFRMADEVLHSGVRGVTDLMVKPGLVNLDFADIRTVMREMGKAMMGTGEASGDKRAIEAAESAISNPLLDDVSLEGARAALINITGGPDMTLFEVDEAANRIREEVDPTANIIFGSTFNDDLEGIMRVSVVATGIDAIKDEVNNNSNSINNRYSANNANNKLAVGQKNPFSYMPSKTVEKHPSSVGGSVVDNKFAKNTPDISTTPNETEAKTAMFVPFKKSDAENAEKETVQEIESNDNYQQEEFANDYDEIAATDEYQNTAETPTPAAHSHESVEEDAGPLFVSSEAVRPSGNANYNVSTLPEAIRETRNHAETKPEPTAKSNTGAGIFSKIADVGRAISSKIETSYDLDEYDDEFNERGTAQAQTAIKREPRRKPSSTARAEIKAEIKQTVADTNESEKEDYYDIPAFLRRQAN